MVGSINQNKDCLSNDDENPKKCDEYDCGPERWKCHQGNPFQCIDLKSRFVKTLLESKSQKQILDAMELFIAPMVKMKMIASIIRPRIRRLSFYSSR